MLKAIFLLLFSTLTFASEHATFSLQRWNDKLVVTINHDKGWHTYWKNPGDAGIASTFKFFKGSSELNLKSYEWPSPKRYIEAGDIQTIGYAGKQHFFFESHAGHLKAVINVLICKDICIPGSATLLLGESEQFTSSRKEQPTPPQELEKKFNALPAISELPEGFEYYLTRTKDKNELVLHYSLSNVSTDKLSAKLSLLTSFPMSPFTFKRESLYFKDGVIYGKTTIDWDGEYLDPPQKLPLSGEFSQDYQIPFLFNPTGDENVKVVNLTFSDFSIGSEALDQFYKGLEVADAPPKDLDVASFLTYMILAFLGGLILNLMPCVLPVISLKLFSLIKYQDSSRKKLLRHNLFFTLGVVSTLMALATVIVALKVGGEEIGWGFQLQSPSFILFMMLLLFIMTLNLFGLFEFKTPGGSKLGSAEIKDTIWGDFFTGVLTTILSTPCSAPFLGTALTFAFTTNYFTVYLIFGAIGLGLSFPFLMTALFPSTLKFLPRPGMWMEKLKYILGFTLLVTTIWLYDVFVSLVDFDLISWRVNLLFAFWFFLFFFSKKIKNRFVVATLIVLTLSLTLMAFKDLKLRSQTSSSQMTSSQWSPWSEAKLSELKGELVFMDFTAEWCLTCKVNKKLVMETKAFEEMAHREGVKLLRADWTKRDDHITQFLRRHNVVGVPAYFVQKKDGTIIHLGETISVSKVERSIK